MRFIDKEFKEELIGIVKEAMNGDFEARVGLIIFTIIIPFVILLYLIGSLIIPIWSKFLKCEKE